MDLTSAAADPLEGFSIDDDDDLVDEDVTVAVALDPLRTASVSAVGEGAGCSTGDSPGGEGGGGTSSGGSAARINALMSSLNSSLSEERIAAASYSAVIDTHASTPPSAASLLTSNQESIVAEALSHLENETQAPTATPSTTPTRSPTMVPRSSHTFCDES